MHPLFLDVVVKVNHESQRRAQKEMLQSEVDELDSWSE